MTEPKEASGPGRRPRTDGTVGHALRRLKFGRASEGWEAYWNWLDRVRQQTGATSRQAVIAKALYSVSSYKNWADKAKGAFDDASKTRILMPDMERVLKLLDDVDDFLAVTRLQAGPVAHAGCGSCCARRRRRRHVRPRPARPARRAVHPNSGRLSAPTGSA